VNDGGLWDATHGNPVSGGQLLGRDSSSVPSGWTDYRRRDLGRGACCGFGGFPPAAAHGGPISSPDIAVTSRAAVAGLREESPAEASG
jgi:hypothetical protein